MSLNQLSKEEIAEMSLIDMTYVILENKKQAIPFKEIIDEIIAATGLSESEIRTRIAQYYTDLNIDGRFLCLGDNRWGLRSWYPVDQAEEDTITQIKPKKKKAKKKDDDDLDLEDYDEIDEEDLDYDDLDEFEDEDLLEEDEDDAFDDLDETADFDDDEDIIDDEDEELLEDLDDEELEDDEDLDLEEEDTDEEL